MAVTVLAAVVAVLGSSTYLSFRFWQQESVAASRQQALLAASAARASVETALRSGQVEVARRNLTRLIEAGGIDRGRVWTTAGDVLLDSRREAGDPPAPVWIPDPNELSGAGMSRILEDGSVRAFLSISVPQAAVLEVLVPEPPARTVLRRGAMLAIGLSGVSLLVVVLLLGTMFEREVVAPVHRVEDLLRPEVPDRGATELRSLERSVSRLIEREREVSAIAEDRDRQLAAQDGLARVGGIAAEMAHEFKRPVTSVRTAVAALAAGHMTDEGGRALLRGVDGQLVRLAEVMEDLFSLARPVEMGNRPVRIQEALDDALLQLSGFTELEGIHSRRDYGEDGVVTGDLHRLTQAFLNLLTNAVEAMPQGGALVVRTERDGRDLVVDVVDSGPGLDADSRRRALTPFFSTKSSGTGLGLPLVVRIVEAHRGRLELLEADGGGTVARVRLPMADTGSSELREVS